MRPTARAKDLRTRAASLRTVLAEVNAGRRPPEQAVALLSPLADLLDELATEIGPRTAGEAPTGRTLRDAVEEVRQGDVGPLERFALEVNGAARDAKTGRFGDTKVFISHVWRALGVPVAGAFLRRGPLDAFKARLVEAQRAGLVNLSRADLVEAIDPQDIKDSETKYLDTTWHFVRVNPGRIPGGAL